MNVEIGAEAVLFPEKEYINGIVVAVHLDYKKPTTLTHAHLIERETNYPSSFKLDRCNSQQNFTFTFCNITYYQKERVHGSEERQWLARTHVYSIHSTIIGNKTMGAEGSN
jgi:hypothetical protein